jgi:hypothetical protein
MKRLLHVVAALIVVGSASCGGGSTPTTPAPARANVSISALTVEPSRFGTGYAYSLRMSVTNTGTATGTLQTITYAILVGGTAIRSGSPGVLAVLPAADVPAGGTLTSPAAVIMVDESQQGYATTITATVTYQDTVGSNTATRSESVPALQ